MTIRPFVEDERSEARDLDRWELHASCPCRSRQAAATPEGLARGRRLRPLALLALIVAAYLAAGELAKRLFYRRFSGLA
jgi:hypothetical protein